MKHLVFFILLLLILQACSSSRPSAKSVVRPAEEDSLLAEEMEFRQLDTMVVSPEMEENQAYADEENENIPYRNSYTRRWDLLHMSLELKFDWENEEVHGKARLRLKPWFYTTDTLELDAKSFDIQTISAGGKNKDLIYHYDGEVLKIRLGKKYTRKDTLDLYLEYRGNPSKNKTTGSAAITDDNGLYFIDPRGTDPSLPTQLWSQGETEYNSRWFPTIDKPNERCTGEITLTVPDSMLTLSNGLLVKSVQNADRTRTDTWVMDQPIAPYLFMIAAGPFAKVRETWQGIPVEYYVDKPYAAYAKEIFNHTPEMLEFFSNKLDLKYPWKKFSQVVVRKYVSGAMENVTAVVFGDFIQKTHRELIDEPNDNIVAHELFHHWFGDYVTCESWSNLTLNEGFANYAEYLWSEYKYGKYEADRHRENELIGYLSSVSFGQAHDLIDYHYADKENMFDAHSYNKGGLVLHMLRHYVGEEAFWTTLNRYLRRHAYQSVEVHDLRLAFEETTGEDLSWFFNQWYLNPGHPNLSYSHTYDATSKTVSLQISQTQEKTFPQVFRLPLDADIHYSNGEIERKRLWLDQRSQQFEIAVDSKPNLIVLDPDRVLLTEWDEPELTAAEYKIQWKSCNNLQLKLNALNALTEEKDYIQIWREALQDPYWYFRLRALDYPPSLKPEDINKLKLMALRDPHSQVRAAAIRILGEGPGIQSLEATLDNILEADSAYVVLGEALKALSRINPAKAGNAVKAMENEKNPYIQEAIAEVLAAENNPASLDYFDKKLTNDPSLAANLLDKYLAILKDVPADVQYSKAGFLFEQSIKPALDKTDKFYFVRALFEVKEMILTRAVNEKDQVTRASLEERVKKIKSWIQEIKEKETDVQLKSILGQFN